MRGISLLQYVVGQTTGDELSKLQPDGVARSLQEHGGYYLAALAIIFTLWLARKYVRHVDASAKAQSEQAAESAQIMKAQAEVFSKHLEKKDEAVSAQLRESTEAIADVGAAMGIVSVELRQVRECVEAVRAELPKTKKEE